MATPKKSKTPQTQTQLWTRLHFAYVAKTSPKTGSVPSTQMIFSIHDGTDFIAWYRYLDTDNGEAFSKAMNREFEASPTHTFRPSIHGFGASTVARSFTPSKPRVVGFAGPYQPRTRLRIQRSGDAHLQVGLFLNLADGNEDLSWVISTAKGVEVPREHEWGSLWSLVVEPLGTGLAKGFRRFII
jgi:hypothetical protein